MTPENRLMHTLIIGSGMGMTVKLDAAVSGFQPGQDSLAICAGHEIEPDFDGILVDDHLRTSDPDMFALGDVAECAGGRIHAYVIPIRQQAGTDDSPRIPSSFAPRAKIHGFTAAHPYLT